MLKETSLAHISLKWTAMARFPNYSLPNPNCVGNCHEKCTLHILRCICTCGCFFSVHTLSNIYFLTTQLVQRYIANLFSLFKKKILRISKYLWLSLERNSNFWESTKMDVLNSPARPYLSMHENEWINVRLWNFSNVKYFFYQPCQSLQWNEWF